MSAAAFFVLWLIPRDWGVFNLAPNRVYIGVYEAFIVAGLH